MKHETGPMATVLVLVLAAQGCSTSGQGSSAGIQEPAQAGTGCDTIFHCPAKPEDIRICQQQNQLEVRWQSPEAHRFTGSLGDTFTTHYSQRFQVIEATLSWQRMGVRYTAYHYLDESRPEILEETGITLQKQGQSRTITCNDNAVSNIARLHETTPDGQATRPSTGD